MQSYPYAPKVALLSVSDKTNITELARTPVDLLLKKICHQEDDSLGVSSVGPLLLDHLLQ